VDSRSSPLVPASGSPGDGVVAFQVLITYRLGSTTLDITTKENVARAHSQGYAWQNWFSNEDRDAPATWRSLIDMCVDGTMTSRPVAYERVLSDGRTFSYVLHAPVDDAARAHLLGERVEAARADRAEVVRVERSRHAGDERGSVEGTGRGAHHEVEAAGQAKTLERGGHPSRDDATHAAALDHEGDTVGITALARRRAARSSRMEQL
jgi:hypothetical protein